MVQLILALVILGVIIFLVMKSRRKKLLNDKTDELNRVLEQSELLDTEEEIINEQLKQKRHSAKLNKLKEKLNETE